MLIDSLLLVQLLIDFGLVILILMVQLIIYPSFSYYKREDLIKWHQKYTGAIGIIVGPLMVAQLFLSVYVVFGRQQNLLGGAHLFLVLATWISTAVQFVPIHNKITKGIHSKKDLENLVFRNWVRVLLWLLIISISVLHYVMLTDLIPVLS